MTNNKDLDKLDILDEINNKLDYSYSITTLLNSHFDEDNKVQVSDHIMIDCIY